MRYKYDAKTDILVLKLSDGKPDFGEQKGNVITHFTKNGSPVEIEILDASRTARKIIGIITKATKHMAAVSR